MSDPNISYRLLARSLERLGYEAVLVDIDGDEHVEYRHPEGWVWRTSTSLVEYPFNSSELTELSDNKSKGYHVAARSGMLVPDYIVIGPEVTADKQTLAEMIHRYGRLVVKPDASYGSRGVSVGITTISGVESAVVKARSTKQQHANILVQQQVDGSEFRFTVLNGKVVSVMLRETARVIGDGSTSIAELIRREDAERDAVNKFSMVRYPSIAEVADDPNIIGSQAVLADDESLILARSAMISGGTSVYEIAETIHPSHKELAERFATELQAGFIAIDLFIAQPTLSSTETTVYFNEVNRSPALKMLYASRNGLTIDVVEQLAQAIDTYLRNRGKALT